MMPSTRMTLAAIDGTLEKNQESSFRQHLGGSVIGRPCMRSVWYVFRWAKEVRHKAKVLRIFDRGKLEEARFLGWLRKAGMEVLDVNPKTGKQWLVTAHGGHFGGSLDGVGYGSPDLPLQYFLTEFKTHGDKSFQLLLTKGLRSSKPEHFAQVQVYMHLAQLPICLYIAINKNSDDLHLEWIRYDEEAAKSFMERAKFVIESEMPPPKCSESPSWFECMMCNFKEVCHYGEVPHVNCRTCAHSTPVLTGSEGAWHCANGCEAVRTAPESGCGDHVFNPYIVGDVEIGEVGSNGRAAFVEFILPNGERIKNGPSFVNSCDLAAAFKERSTPPEGVEICHSKVSENMSKKSTSKATKPVKKPAFSKAPAVSTKKKQLTLQKQSSK